MQRNLRIALLGVVLIVVVGLMYSMLRGARTKTPVLPPTSSSVPQGDRLEAATGKVAAATSGGAVTQRTSGVQADRLARLVDLKNGPIDFLGKVIDQDGNAIKDAKIRITTRHWLVSPIGSATFMRVDSELQTNGDGIFHLTGVNGQDVNVESIVKEGYEFSPKARRWYGYHQVPDRFTPDLNNPVVFRMWKKTGGEPLVVFTVDTRIPYDGTTSTFDIINQKQSSGATQSGDFRVALTRSPLKITSNGQRYDWVARIEAVDGGVIESNDEFMYQAPGNGYQSQVEIKMPADSPAWSTDKAVSFYLKSRGGKTFARVTVEFRTDSMRETTGFSIQAYANSSGSRNLEPQS